MESRALTKVLGIPIERTVNGARSEMRLITGDEVPASAVVPVSTLVQAVAPVLEPEPDPEPEFSQSLSLCRWRKLRSNSWSRRRLCRILRLLRLPWWRKAPRGPSRSVLQFLLMCPTLDSSRRMW